MRVWIRHRRAPRYGLLHLDKAIAFANLARSTEGYGVALVSRIDKIIGLFRKRAL